jgi:hypothetical protein
MPPEFLPVPVRPINANVNMNAPVEARGAVEIDWEPGQMTVEGRN